MELKPISPAPWTLKGNGVVFLYQFPSEFIQQYGFMADYQRESFKGGLGAVMLMDYASSGVGPYQELLFIPGLFKLNGKRAFSISNIYVSTFESVRSGQRNWAIPKDLADFKVTDLADGSRLWRVRKDGKTIFEASVINKGISFPFTTLAVPFTKIIQQNEEGFLLTNPAASGKAQFSRLQMVNSDPEYFPPIGDLKPISTISLPSFRLKFPVAVLV